LGLVDELKFPAPSEVVQAAWNLRTDLPGDILVTSARVLAGLTAGVLGGVGLGLLMSLSKKVFYFFNPLIESMRPVPAIAMVPFFLLWFGLSETGKFLLVALGVFAIMVVTTIEAVRNVPRIFVRAAQTLGARPRQVFRSVILPGILPQMIGPLRVCAALSFTLVVAAEFMGAQYGLGFRLNEARRLFNPATILLGVTLLGMMSALLDAGLRGAAKYMTRWTDRNI
jgi:ABC-type nitrate/sulfonate/bicarbonate transport system permease component